ncbi:MAG: AEC family transporter [Halothece sp.]
MLSQLFDLYVKLGGGIFLGWLLGRYCGKRLPNLLGQFLFYLGVPVGIIAFIRNADLSGNIWLAPMIAWSAIALGALLAWLWLRLPLNNNPPKKIVQGSLLLTSMFGNTGYLGYPIILAMVGEKYFGWAVFYDLLGTTLGAYGLGALLGSYFNDSTTNSPSFQQPRNIILPILTNPPLWGFGIALWLRQYQFIPIVENGLQVIGWGVITLSLILIGMRLSQLQSWQSLPKASVSLAIKMLIVPLSLGLLISPFNLSTGAHQVMVLEMAMPPAFATVVVSETYQLDYELTVTAVAFGSTGLLVMLPFWLVLLGN